jgi:hypothetical protein
MAAGAAQHMLIHGFIERAGSDFTLTERGRAVLEVLDEGATMAAFGG